jgi:hypothetical protein
MVGARITSSDARTVIDTHARRHAQRGRRQRRRIGGLILLLVISAVMFIFVVSWHRDLARIKAAMDAATAAANWIQAYSQDRGHLPFELPEAATDALSPLSVPYPTRADIYRLGDLPGPFVLVAGSRQGLLLREAGCAAVVFEDGAAKAKWLTYDEVVAARQRRADLLSGAWVPDPT